MNSNSTDALRITHHIVLGIDKARSDDIAIDEAYEQLKLQIAVNTGGVTAFKSDGIWFRGYELGDRSGGIEHDIALNFLVTLKMEEELYGLWDNIKTDIRRIVQIYNLGCEHIHCTAWWSQARHFRADCVAISNCNINTDKHQNTEGKNYAP